MRRAALLASALLAACAAPARGPEAPRAAPAARPPAEAKAEGRLLPASELPLAFERGYWHLDGTLTLPARREGERVPAVVIVHGSGPMSRDGVMRGQLGLGFGFELPVYKQLAAALASQGYAVYRYDKRTCGSFNDCSDSGPSAIPYSMLSIELSTGEYVRDAEAALDRLLERPEIDPARTFFVGHSEGAQLLPALLSERPAVRAGVMLAPPFHTMTVLLEQQGKLLRWALAASGQRERAEREGQLLLDAARSLKQIEQGTHLGAPVLGQPPGIWASWIELASSAPTLARKLDRPLLVLGGRYDYNVVASEIEDWARWLDDAPGTRHRVRVLDCVTHALNCISQPDPARITPADIAHDLSPELLREVVSFLSAQAPVVRLSAWIVRCRAFAALHPRGLYAAGPARPCTRGKGTMGAEAPKAPLHPPCPPENRACVHGTSRA